MSLPAFALVVSAAVVGYNKRGIILELSLGFLPQSVTLFFSCTTAPRPK
jgi:hypothetical protein